MQPSILDYLDLGSANPSSTLTVEQNTISAADFTKTHKSITRSLAKHDATCIVLTSSNVVAVVQATLAALEANKTVIVASPWRRALVLRALDAVGMHVSAQTNLSLPYADVEMRFVASSMSRAREASDPQPQLVFATSGSTSHPKLVPFQIEQVRFLISAIQRRLDYQPSDTIGSAFQAAFDYGFYQILLALRAGSNFVWFDGMRFPAQAKHVITSQGVTVLPLTPAYGSKLLGSFENSDALGESVRMITNTGSQLSAFEQNRIRRSFPHAKIVNMYGLTECKRVSIATTALSAAKPDSVGFPLDGTRVQIVDANGSQVEPGEQGEAVVYGPHVSKRYFGVQPDSPSSEGLRTGDMMAQDSDGALYHFGRVVEDTIKIDDELVSLLGIRQLAFESGCSSLIQVKHSNGKIEVLIENDDLDSDDFLLRIQNHHGRKVSKKIVVSRNAQLRLSDNGKVEQVE